MKQFIFTGWIVLALLGLTACSSGSGTDRPQPEQTTQTAEAAGNMDREETASQAQTEYISAVPEEYFAPSGHPGQVVEITYDSLRTLPSPPSRKPPMSICPMAMTRRTRKPGMISST